MDRTPPVGKDPLSHRGGDKDLAGDLFHQMVQLECGREGDVRWEGHPRCHQEDILPERELSPLDVVDHPSIYHPLKVDMSCAKVHAGHHGGQPSRKDGISRRAQMVPYIMKVHSHPTPSVHN